MRSAKTDIMQNCAGFGNLAAVACLPVPSYWLGCR